MYVYTAKHERLVLEKEYLGKGGFGEVYGLVSPPDRYKNSCVKVYYEKYRNKEVEQRIKFMASNPPENVLGDRYMIGWPMEHVTDIQGQFMGFVMPLAFPDSKKLVVLTTTNLSKKLPPPWMARFDRGLGKTNLLARMKLMCNIAGPIHRLHSTGKYVLRDLKPDNVLVTYDGRVTLVDMDSVQIAEGGRLLFPGLGLTQDYVPPEFYSENIGKSVTDRMEPSWDSFAMGVMFYQILFGLHPFAVTPKLMVDDSSNELWQNISSNLFPFGAHADRIRVVPIPHQKFTKLPAELQDLFTRALSEDRFHRPSAEDWGKCFFSQVKKAEEKASSPKPAPAPVSMPKQEPKPEPKPKPKPTPEPPVAEEVQTTEKELSEWNWGGFLLGWVWGVGNGIFWPLVGIALYFIPYVGMLFTLGISVVLGIKGTRWAWESKNKSWGSWDRFREIQRKWRKAGIWYAVIVLTIAFVAGIMEAM